MARCWALKARSGMDRRKMVDLRAILREIDTNVRIWQAFTEKEWGAMLKGPDRERREECERDFVRGCAVCRRSAAGVSTDAAKAGREDDL